MLSSSKSKQIFFLEHLILILIIGFSKKMILSSLANFCQLLIIDYHQIPQNTKFMYKTAFYTAVGMISFSVALLFFFTSSKFGWFGEPQEVEPFYFAFWSVLLIFGIAGVVVSKKFFKD